MPAHKYEYNGTTIYLPFSVGDRVGCGDEHGTVVTVNHDDVDSIRYLVKFDKAPTEWGAASDLTVALD